MEARWSPEYLKRQELMKNKTVPTMSQVKATAGLPLALVLFEECHPELQDDLGLTPPLDGPKGELWVSPSDLLIGKVVLKPPLSQKHIQALTHQGILEIGSDVEHKFINEMRLERDKLIKEREEYLGKIFEIQKTALADEIREEERLKYGEEMNDMRTFFENKTCQLLWECYEQIRQLEEEMQVEFNSINVLWQQKLEQEVQSTVEKITKEFLEKMGKQEQLLVNIFHKQINTLEMKRKCAVDFERIKCRELIIQMKHKLHCQNIANLMYLLCKERRKCKGEKTEMENHYTKIIRKHKSNVRRKDRIIRDLTEQKKKKIRQLNVRERCLVEILRQFQKFIYFALKATPTQGEFLLNINKLIKFELEDYCISEEEKEKPVVIKPETIPVYDYSTEVETFLEASEPISDEERLEYSDVLPAFYFNEKMYVREDFRDRFSAGLELDKKNSLWNPDVEELLDIFRKNLNEKKNLNQIGKIKSQVSSVHFHPDKLSSDSIISDQILTISPKRSPPLLGSPTETKTSPLQITPVVLRKSPTTSQSSRQGQWTKTQETSMYKKTASIDESEEKEIRKVSLAPSAEASSKKTTKKSKENDDFDIRPVTRDTAATQSKLTLARDSIILHISNMERKSLQIMKLTDETLSRISDKASKTSPHEEESTENENLRVESQKSLVEGSTGSKPTSRLLLVQDSYELIRSQIALVSDKDKEKEKPAEEPPRKEKRKSQLSFGAKVTKIPIEPEDVKYPPKTKNGVKPPIKKTVTPKSTPRTVKVVGSSKTREDEKPIEVFTEERIRSLVNVMKENPSLIRLFTPCSK